ncbi:MAG: PHP domain-containing protein [Candidatus Bipolaricaulota bacterium]|nr:PHP domain-containing protein [Candidatus Bipolaricaulota bacterium]
MRWWRADLHIHSTLSPCASLAMSPARIVAEAHRAGLDLIAICDHNAAEAGRYVRRLAGAAPAVLMGMEIQTAEEVEILAYFTDEESPLLLQEELQASLPDIPCDPELFGDQVVVDEREEIVRRVDRLLLSPVDLPLSTVVRRIEDRGGLAVPAHVDRVPGGLLAVLGLFPEGEWPLAVEIAPWTPVAAATASWPGLGTRPILRGSDAHYPEEIGRAWTELYLAAPTLDELRAALRGEGGRRVRPGPELKEEW